jgi:hypothetical protein
VAAPENSASGRKSVRPDDQFGSASFAICEALPDAAGRDTHLNGKVATALMAKAAGLFTTTAKIEKARILADKLA